MITELNDEDQLYRFISFDCLLDHMVNKKFYFVKYKKFDDPWEGFSSKCDFRENEYDSYSILIENRSFIMCLTKREVSDAMWRIYSKDNRGVRIQTSVKKLRNLVADAPPDFECYLRKVTYDDDIANGNFFINKFPNATEEEKVVNGLFFKRKAFEHEEEVRLLLYSKVDRPNEDIFSIPYDPNEIIENILLDPRIDKKTKDVQTKTVQNLGFKGGVFKSTLYDYKWLSYKT